MSILKEQFDIWKAENGNKKVWFDNEIETFLNNCEALDQTIVKAEVNSIDDLYESYDISVRLFNVLYRAKITTLESLANHERQEIAGLKNIGRKTMYDLEKLMKKHGVSFK